MTQRKECIQHCMNYLKDRNLSNYFNEADFNHIYRKFDGANRNAFWIGLHAADFIIINSKPKSDEFDN